MAEEPKKRQLRNAAQQLGLDRDDLKRLLKLPDDTPDTHLVQMVLARQLVEGAREQTLPIPGGTPAPARSSRRRSRSVSAPGLLPAGKRVRNELDEQWLAWLAAVVDLDGEIRKGEHGNPFRPTFEQRGTKITYPDPFLEFLRTDKNSIYVDFGMYQEIMADDRHLPWRSTQLLRMVEEALAALWLAPTTCKGCKGPMSGKLGFDFAKSVLGGSIVLPGSRGRKKLEHNYPEYHPWCNAIVTELVALEVAIQGLQGDDPESQALRTNKYVDVLAKVKQEFESQGMSFRELQSAFLTIIGRSSSAS